jgi:hypothetical protein
MELVLSSLVERQREITIIWKIYTHKDSNEVNLEKLDGIGPVKEFP